jgi:hypothetical protein
MRELGAVVLSVVVFAISLLHFQWSRGSHWPEASEEALACAVVGDGRRHMPHVFVGRGLAGYVPRWRALFCDEPFATRDKRFYSPLCIVLGLGHAVLGSADFAA